MCRRLFVLALFLLIASPAFPATTDDEVRATFDRFIVAQNAHDLKALEGLLLDSPQLIWIDTAEIFVPIDFSIGTQQTRFLMNQVLVKTESGWKVASILPIPLPPPGGLK